TLNPSSAEDWRALIRSAVPSGGSLRGAIYLNSAAPGSDGLSLAELRQAQEHGCIGALHLVQALVHYGVTPRLWFVTRGAQSIHRGASAAVAAAPIWGFGRVLAREHPELRPTLVDL